MGKPPKGSYPPEWENGIIQRIMCEVMNWQCEHCGAWFNKDRKALELLNADGNPAVLTVHHLDNNKWNIHWTNLLVCCQACHLHVQAKWKPGDPLPPEWNPLPDWIARRDLIYTKVQLSLFGENDHASNHYRHL